MALPRLLNTEEACREFLHVKPDTAFTWRSLGRGPAYVKMGRRVFYTEEALIEFMRKNTRHPKPKVATPPRVRRGRPKKAA